MEEAKALPDSINKEDFKERIDFTDKLIFTIDGDDSKDFDDAISLEKNEVGNYILGVYIADVSEYVKWDHPLDEEALYRATSVYLADRVIPMLPHKLSNGICSLNEGVDRLVLACIMELDLKGNLKDYKICEGIINSRHRMTYNNVNKMIDGDEETISKYKDIYPTILEMVKLSDIIREKRVKKGAIDFEIPEYAIKLNEKGEPIDFKLRTRKKAELLIEDFMLSANETVAYHMSISNLPCVYRVHEEPDNEKVKAVFEMLKSIGVKQKLNKNKILPLDIQKAMNEVKGKNEEMVINTLMLRSMMKARYFEKNLGHYGLAMQYYCHFTSPIRRYPDLMTHRIIKHLILHPQNFDKDLERIDYEIHDICVMSSQRERNAIDCEREVDDMLTAWYMQNHIDEVYEGIIDSIVSFGMFVMLDSGIEGLIHIKNMQGYFNFNEPLMRFEGKNVVYKIGDKVKIRVIGASKKERKVDFVLDSDYEYYKSEGSFYD
jgi:ribonuclease R